MQRTTSGLIGVWRLAWGALVALHPSANVVAQLYGWTEVVTAGAGITNAVRAKSVDARLQGWLAPVCYSLGFVVLPAGKASPIWTSAALVSVLIFRMWAFFVLGLGYSVGVATWLRLADAGPYRWVRHPMQLSGLAIRLVFCLANPWAWNWFGLALMGLAAVVVVRVEESFLGERTEWRAYAAQVRWRLVPGVW